jgi:hypothetical protein
MTSTPAEGQAFESTLMAAIAAAAPRAAMVQNWRADARSSVDIVVGFTTSIFVAEARAWTGKISFEPGTLRIERGESVYRVPDPRPALARLLRPLREVRNRFAHGLAGDNASDSLLLQAMIVVPDGAVLSAGGHNYGIEVLTFSDFCSRLRECSEAGTTVAELNAKLDRIIASRSGMAQDAPSMQVSRGLPAVGSGFLGRKDVVTSLVHAVERGERVLLTGFRGTGKTSVLYAVKHELERSNRRVFFGDLSMPGEAVASTLGRLPSGTAVLLDDVDIAMEGRDDAVAKRLQDAIEQSGVAMIAASTGTPWFFAGAPSTFVTRWQIYSLGAFTPVDLRQLCSALPKGLQEGAFEVAYGALGGHPLLCVMLVELLRERAVVDASALPVAVDHIVRHLEHRGLGHVSREMADALVRSGFQTKDLPVALSAQAQALASTGWFRLDGWTLRPVAPVVADVVASSLPARGGQQSEPRRVSRADEVDPWSTFFSAANVAWSPQELLDVFDVPDKDRALQLPVEDRLRRHIAERLGIRGVKEVLTRWFGHRDRRRLAACLGLDIEATPPHELGQRILAKLLEAPVQEAMP